jgi:hypothetical protein
MEELVLWDSFGTSSSNQFYSLKDNRLLPIHDKSSQLRVHHRNGRKRYPFGLEQIRQFIYSAFLPEGYPDSVSKDYLAYQKWDSIQVRRI